MSEVANTPDSMEIRTSAVESGVTLADTLNTVEEQLYDLMDEMNNRVKVLVGEVDSLAQKNYFHQ